MPDFFNVIIPSPKKKKMPKIERKEAQIDINGQSGKIEEKNFWKK